MNPRSTFRSAAMVVLAVALILVTTAVSPAFADEIVSTGRALSLRALEERLARAREGHALPADATTLGNITRLDGFIIDTEHNDIVLFGESLPTDTPLQTDDFIAALRSAWCVRTGNCAGPREDPGCSIDLDPAVAQRLDAVDRDLRAAETESQIDRVVEEWEWVCGRPQKVRVMGVPFYSHFAQVMVDADYEMKLLVDGTDDSLDIEGFKTLRDMHVQLQQAGKRLPSSSTNRFWFTPGRTIWTQADSAAVFSTAMLMEAPVHLMTEHELLDSSKRQFVGSGSADPLAEEFCKQFVRHYREIADRRPIYEQLENLFRMAAAAQQLVESRADVVASAGLPYLLGHHGIRRVRVPEHLPGRSAFLQYESYPPGTPPVVWRHLSCGGVTMRYTPETIGFDPDAEKRRKLRAMAATVLGSRTSPDDTSWGWASPTDPRTEIWPAENEGFLGEYYAVNNQ